jgi:hypothetical protein
MGQTNIMSWNEHQRWPLKQQCIRLLIIAVQVNSSKYFFIVQNTLFACYAHTPSGHKEVSFWTTT